MKNITKTTIFASVIFALVFSVANTNLVYAEEIPEEIFKLAEKGTKIADKIERLEAKQQTEIRDLKIERLQDKLDNITSIVNTYGFFAPDQEIIDNTAPHTTTPSDAITQASCSISCDNPIVIFRNGFDWDFTSYWSGTTYSSNWEQLTVAGTFKNTEAHASNWYGYLSGTAFTQIYVDPAGTTADVQIHTIVSNQGALSKDWGSHNEYITNTSIQKIYETGDLSPGKAKDHYILKVTLVSIS